MDHHFLLQGDLPDTGIEPVSPVSPVLQVASLPLRQDYLVGKGFPGTRQESKWMHYIMSAENYGRKCYISTAKPLQSCPTMFDPIDGSPSGSPVPGTLQARTLEGFHFLLQCMKVKSESEVAQSCPTLSEPMDCSLPGSFVHGIFQARVLEWVAIALSEYKH